MRIVVGLLLVGTLWLGTARGTAAAISPEMIEREETYELRLQRLMQTKGLRAMVEHLKRELAERPRPYVKAWYASYLLYGEEHGLKDVADPERGFALAEESREEGSLFGLELVGRAWGDGRGTGQRNAYKAVHYLGEAARYGRDTAMSELGKFYFFGAGVKRNREKAEEWMRKAAWRGATGGLANLAGWWEDAKYAGTPDGAKALALYYEAAKFGSSDARALLRERAKGGDVQARKYMHLHLVEVAAMGADVLPAKLRAAVKWLEENSRPDETAVQVALAAVMLERTFVVYDPRAAREKLARAAAAGSDDARYLQALMTWAGIGEKRDPATGIAIWRQLAERENALALSRIGWLHWWGNGQKYGVPKDAAQAFACSKRAADLGDWWGQANTAECYAHGIGVEVNYHLAAKYYGNVEDRGSPAARRMKDRVLAHVED